MNVSFFFLSSVVCRLTPPEPENVVLDSMTWWLWRGARTRSHPELGRENPQRPWYCVSRHGRVGRRQVVQSRSKSSLVSCRSSDFAFPTTENR